MTVSGRFFLVGCPRSGTTLLQSLLAAHPNIHSFPESHFFPSLLKDRKRLYQKLKLSSSAATHRLKDFLAELERKDLYQAVPSNAIFEWQHTRAFIRILDALTEEENKSSWLEKTPRHLHYIDDIQRLVPNAKFIHIIREGKDVVASVYEVTHKYPEVWGGARNIDTCIQRWGSDFKISQRYSHQPNHYLVSYERLTNNIQNELEALCDFLNIEFEATMLKNYRTVAQNVSLTNEPWKVSNRDDIRTRKADKFSKLFSLEEQNYIENKISSYIQ